MTLDNFTTPHYVACIERRTKSRDGDDRMETFNCVCASGPVDDSRLGLLIRAETIAARGGRMPG
jgi:hypothetical protein